MFTTLKRMSGWKVLRLRWTSYTVTPSHRYSPGEISLVNSCEGTMVISLPAHHEPLAAIEFVKGGADCGDPALIAQVEFHAYGVTKGERLYCVTLQTPSTTASPRPPGRLGHRTGADEGAITPSSTLTPLVQPHSAPRLYQRRRATQRRGEGSRAKAALPSKRR